MPTDAYKRAEEHYRLTAHKHGWGSWRYVSTGPREVVVRTAHLRDPDRQAQGVGRNTPEALVALARAISEKDA